MKTKFKIFLSLPLILSSVQAQNTYDWTVEPSFNSWGSYGSRYTGGTYTRQSSMASRSNGDPAVTESWEGGMGGSISSIFTVGQSNRNDTSNVFDLSTVGSTTRLRTTWDFAGVYPDFAPNVAQLFQVGLISGDNLLNESGGKSIYIAGLESGVTSNGGVTNLPFKGANSEADIESTVDIGVWTGSSGENPDPVDGVMPAGWGSEVDLVTETFRSVYSNDADSSGLSVAAQYTNIGGGEMRVDIGLTKYYFDDQYSRTIKSSAVIYADSVVVTHGMSNAELANLMPVMGFFNNNSETSVTGTNYDWTNDIPWVIPEPSSALLVLFGLAPLLKRRKK